MTTTNGRTLAPLTPAQPARIGQGTAVEQSRAVAEVHAAIVVAQERRRDINLAVASMYRSCAMKSLADRAFYSYRRGSETVQGATVQLARELARCWGNIQYGLTELRRDDTYGQSEMQAWAWDVETNARASTTFVVPHRRDRSEAKGGSVALTDMRDIYENNANHGARRLREMIFAILPAWFTEDATAACYEALAGDDSDGTTHPERVANCVERFKTLGVSEAQLEKRVGAPAGRWSPFDLAQLGVVYRSIMRRETSLEDEFPAAAAAQRVTAADITGRPEPQTSGPAVQGETPGSGPAAGPETSGGPVDPPAQRATKAQTGELENLLAKFPWQDGDKAAFLQWRCGAPYRASKGQVIAVSQYLRERLEAAGGDTAEALSAVWREYQASQDQGAHETAGPGDGDG